MQSHDTETAHGKQAFLLPTENPSTDVNRVLKDDPSILYAMPQNSAQMQTNIAQGAGNRTSYMYNEKPIGAVSEQSHSSSPPIQYVGSKDPKNTLHKAWRTWETKYQEIPERPGIVFTVASYNVLAQNLLEDHPQLYSHCPRHILIWSYRRNFLLQEIQQYQPDILCLQEVNGEHYQDFFEPELKKLGYDGKYKQRTTDKKDGCATFYKRRKFKLVKSMPVEYIRKNDNLLDRDNVALLLLLKARRKSGKSFSHSPRTLCVANTHLLFNPRRGDIKLAQMIILLASIDRICWHGKSLDKPRYHPVILCGDLNSLPHCDLYRFIVQAQLRYEGKLSRHLSGQNQNSGRDIFLGKYLLDHRLGISDQCQFIDDVLRRYTECGGHIKHSSVPRATVISDGIGETSHQNPHQHGDTHALHDHNKLEKSTSAETISETARGKRKRCDSEDLKIKSSLCEASNYYSQNSGTVRHSLQLNSVYQHGYRNSGRCEPEATTCHKSANCTVDYIFYSVLTPGWQYHDGRSPSSLNVTEGRLRLLSRLKLLTCQEMNQLGYLPNSYIASDHMILIAKFKFELFS